MHLEIFLFLYFSRLLLCNMPSAYIGTCYLRLQDSVANFVRQLWFFDNHRLGNLVKIESCAKLYIQLSTELIWRHCHIGYHTT